VKQTPKKVPKNKPQQQNNKRYASLLQL